MICSVLPRLSSNDNEFENIIRNFAHEGTLIGSNTRNVVKYFNINGTNINVKSFKVPNPVNKVVYRFLRKSKAKRSFENARFLLSKGLLTPEPLTYLEYHDLLGLTSSYYICRQLDDIVELRKVIDDKNFAGREMILKKYTAYFFRMHELGIEFLDNSPGNTLIQKNGTEYDLYLVDLNRMNFKKSLGVKQRMNNFSRLTTDREILKIIAEEYAVLSGQPSALLLELMTTAAEKFRQKKLRKKYFKKKLACLKKWTTIQLSCLSILPSFAT
jgi:glycosyltransferase involved in cell wall biosynthesis